MINKIDRTAAKCIRDVVQEHLNEAAKELGLSGLEVGRMTWQRDGSGGKFSVTMTPQVVTDSGEKLSAAEARWNRHAPIHGLKKGWFEQSFNTGSTTYTIIDFRPKARKNNVIVRTQRGTEYVMPDGEVAMFMKMKEQEIQPQE